VIEQAAPQKVLNEILMAHEGVRDDTSLIVVDIMPAGKAFKECCAPRFAAMSGCLCRYVFPLLTLYAAVH
jgi:hypothetical protein